MRASFFSASVCLSALCLAGPAMAQDYLLGSDLSYANEMDDCGAVFRDGGEAQDVYELFAAKGNDIVRLRLWHSPDWTDYSTLADVKKSIRRAKAAGMKVLLDFHYSDDWADPGDQIIPAAWKGLDDEALAEAVYDYTLSTLLELDGEGLMPDMVQVGNETNTEILLEQPIEEDTPIDWNRNVRFFNAGILAVREAARVGSSAPRVMLHIAQPENVEPWFDDAIAAGIADFDVIGISYYPKWSSRSMEGLGQTIRRVRHKYGKDVIVVETSYPWTLEANDQASNILGEDSLIPAYPASLQGQKDFLTDLTQTVISNDGQGVVYWEPAWVSNGCSTRWGKGSHWENNTFFDYKGTNAHSGFDFLTHEYNEPEPLEFVFAASADAPATAYLWASFLEGTDFTIPLRSDGAAYRYSARIPAGEIVTFQLFADAQLSEPLLPTGEGGDATVSITVEEGGNRIEMKSRPGSAAPH